MLASARQTLCVMLLISVAWPSAATTSRPGSPEAAAARAAATAPECDGSAIPCPEGPQPVQEPEGDATAIEYGLIAALIAVVIITALTVLGQSLNEKFVTIATSVEAATAGYEVECPPDCDSTNTESRSGENGSSVSDRVDVSMDLAEMTTSIYNVATVVNGSSAVDAPDTGFSHELAFTLTLHADMPAGGPPGEMAQLRLDFDFTDLAWGINGPVPLQDGRFEIVGPDGSSWSWTMEHDVSTGQLEITSATDPAGSEFVFYEGPGDLDINGLLFGPGQALTGVTGPSFPFEIPYGVDTDVTFILRQTSHSAALQQLELLPALSRRAMLALGLLLAAAGALLAHRRRRAA